MARATSGVPVDLRSISLAFSKAKWRNRDFSYSKAYVCSVFSQWAYAAVSQFDLDQTAQLQRFGMFHASAVFRSLIRTPRKHYFENFIRKQSLEGEGPQDDRQPEILSIVYDELWVLIAFKLRGIIFITIRGTTFCLRDFIDDLEIAHYQPFSDPARSLCGFHRGFYFGVVDLFGKLLVSVEKKMGGKLVKSTVIYVTGHSLGGALAAVLHGYWNRRLYNTDVYQIEPAIFSSYTFGMPRYGNQQAVDLFEGTAQAKDHPFHVVNHHDLVPVVPPKRLDYADSKFRQSSVVAGRKRVHLEWAKKSDWLKRLILRATGVKYHQIENYVMDVGDSARRYP